MKRSYSREMRSALSSLIGKWLLPALAIALLLAPTAAAAAEDPLGQLIELTNLERQKAGLGPLTYNPNLGQSAQSYAELLSTGACWGHNCGPVPDLIDRDTLAGYGGWLHIGENIAGGQQTPERVIANWMASPTHRANILDPSFKEIGVGLALGGPYKRYWAQEFGTR